jgi:hypothetical protein
MALAKMDLNNIIKYDWDTPSEFSVVELSNKYLASKYNQTIHTFRRHHS